MLWAVYHQRLNPLADKLPASSLLSIFFAALPVVVLFWLLVPRRWLAPKAGAMAALTALVIAVVVYGMPPLMAGMAFVDGVLFGLLPVGWTIFNAMLLYNITVETGKFDLVRRSVAGLSGDARIQAILIAFAFGAFLEGAAGGGTPVAICGAIMVGLGFDPFLAAVLCLIANTSPVAYGGLGTPLITLTGVTGLSTETLSVMAGHQLPLLSLVIPLYMVKCMCSWKQTWEVWPALLVAGGSFAVFQFTFATMHSWTGLENIVLYPMTDIGGGIFSLVVTAIFLKFWKPRKEWHFDESTGGDNDQRPRDSRSERSACGGGTGTARLLTALATKRRGAAVDGLEHQRGLVSFRADVDSAAADRLGAPARGAAEERSVRCGSVRSKPITLCPFRGWTSNRFAMPSCSKKAADQRNPSPPPSISPG